MRMANGYDPAAFDIVREEFQERDQRDFREREFERERERPRREEERDLPDSLVEVMNDDSIVLTQEMVDAINDPMVRITRKGELTRRTGRDVIRRSGQFARSAILPRLPDKETNKKRKRKPSKYGKTLGKQIEKLKKKHPRTDVTKLMTKAHAATRKALGMKPKRKKRKK